MKTAGSCLALIIVFFATGCTEMAVRSEPPRGHYYLNPRKDFGTINRVALIELENHSNDCKLPETLTRTLANGLGKTHLFALQTIYRSDPVWVTLDLDDINALSYQDMGRVRDMLNVDAVVFGSIKQYQPFPNLLMSLQLKMVDVRRGDLIWAIEQVWDSSDKQVEMRMKDYFSQTVRDGYQPLGWKMLVTSPQAFNKFVVDEVKDTLPQLSTAHRQL